MKARKSWREKIDGAPAAKLVDVPERMLRRNASLPKKATMLIPHPGDVEVLMRKVPRGKLMSATQLREKLAHDAGANIACPMVTGIFIRIVSEAAEDAAREGKARITPYWRVVREDGSLIEKLPGGPVAQAARLVEEGHTMDESGKLRVKDVVKRLVKFD